LQAKMREDKVSLYLRTAALAAIFAQLDWDAGVTYPPDAPLIGRADLLAAVIDGAAGMDD
jgi:hypothetical protein